jgi:2-polyprenyl-6-methoxyphenol hydroxylase-like FAD-dependent oxidoreductase
VSVRERCDVAIVGYGPTGQTLAILLAQRGWRVTVLERWRSPYPLPRSVHFDHEIGRIFQAAGVGAEARAISEPCGEYEWRNAAGQTLLQFSLDTRPSLWGWPEANMVHQPELERVLDRRARSFRSVSVRRGFEVFEIAPEAERVVVRARDAAGEVREVEARYAIGCDGANSFVRRALHVPVEDLGVESDWLIVDVITYKPCAWRPANWQLCDPARPTTVISGGPGRRRFEFMRLPDESIESLNDSRAAWCLLARWGLSESNTVLERHAVYSFHARWAETWRSGRVLLAGDAAHQIPPFPGQGMSAGLRDAATLAWKLDLVLGGRAAEELLDTYAQERLPHVRSFIDMSVSFGRVIGVTDPEEAAARDAELVALGSSSEFAPRAAAPRMGPGTALRGDPNAGELFPQGRVGRCSRGRACEGLFDDLVGRGWLLLGADADPKRALDREQRELLASLGGVTAHIGPGSALADLDGTYRSYFERAGARVALVRPDFHVFGTGKSPADARALVSALQRELEAPFVALDD